MNARQVDADKFPLPASLSVPEAGRRFWGLGRDAAYAAAARGQVPCVRVGRTLRVPTHAALEQLGWPHSLIARALGLDPDLGAAAEESLTMPTDSLREGAPAPAGPSEVWS